MTLSVHVNSASLHLVVESDEVRSTQQGLLVGWGNQGAIDADLAGNSLRRIDRVVRGIAIRAWSAIELAGDGVPWIADLDFGAARPDGIAHEVCGKQIEWVSVAIHQSLRIGCPVPVMQ